MSGPGTGPFWIDPYDETAGFPDVSLALKEPDGLLAVGGSLTPKRLLDAYRKGIFPWYSEGQPILWWSPNPRAVLIPKDIKVSRSARKIIGKGLFTTTLDQGFRDVVTACSRPRNDDSGTWITAPMIEAYCRLHELNFAHSAECWFEGRLVGGLYGVAMGRVFFGESMFSLKPNASKIALIHLAHQLDKWQYVLIDCQVQSQHLRSLGAIDMPRAKFIELLAEWCKVPGRVKPWQFDSDLSRN